VLHQGERAVQRRAGVTADGWGSAGVDPVIPAVAAAFLRQQRLVVIAAVVTDRLPGTDDPLAGRFDTGHDVGMLMIEPPTRRRMRVNGRARRDGDRLVVRTEQVYSNCPKYIQTRDHAADVPAARRSATVGRELTDDQRRWIAGADTFFVGTYAPGHGVDASHRGGNPGFVTVAGSRLTWPDYVGNSMYMTLGNLHLEPRCGLLFLDWDNGHTLHLTGRAKVDWDPGRAAGVTGAQRLVDFDVERVVQVDGGIPQRWAFGRYSRFNPA
jgi:predicted pyridoxine 5'-phosphate oxidase superfamily flavin-nucleotide-binding protein